MQEGDLELVTYSLGEFIGKVEEMENRATDDETDWLRLLLTGEISGEYQVVIDALRNALATDHSIDILRDYDSVLGVSRKIEVCK